MKKILVLTVLILITAATAQADQYLKINKGIKGLLLGAGGGALAGQAIGRDTQSTLIGTSIGTLVGYVVGNEMDKNSFQYQNVSYQPRYEPRYQELPSSYRNEFRPVPSYHVSSGGCREVEILGTVQGIPEKIITTACPTPEGWILQELSPKSAAGYRYVPREPLPRRSVNNSYRPRGGYYDQRGNYQY